VGLAVAPEEMEDQTPNRFGGAGGEARGRSMIRNYRSEPPAEL
jgi:hypothetical protein